MKVLKADDFEKGRLVTIHSQTYECSGYFGGMFGVITSSGNGCVYEIIAVDLPYVVLRGLGGGSTSVFDTRTGELAVVSQEYAEAVTGNSCAAYFKRT